jgi:hypothetical protein
MTAVSIAAVFTASAYTKSWNVTSPNDSDTAATVSHGFGVAPALVWLVPLLSANCYGHQWAVGTVTASTIPLTATSASGSGLAGTPQVQVIAMLPTSII